MYEYELNCTVINNSIDCEETWEDVVLQGFSICDILQQVINLVRDGHIRDGDLCSLEIERLRPVRSPRRSPNLV